MKLIALCFTCLVLATHAEGDISFRASPPVAVTTLNDDVTLSCRIPASVSDVYSALLVKIEKVDGEAFTVFKTTGQLKINADNRTEAEGSLHGANGEGGSTVLTVKILEPVESDSGTYKCSLVYLDKNLNVKTPYTLVNLNVSAVPVAVHVPQPEMTPSCDCDDIWTEINNIKASLTAGGTAVVAAGPAPAGQCQVSFAARFSSNIDITDDDTAIFDTITSNKGGAYDVTTGEFTAPCNGQYYFSVVLRSEQDLDAGYVDGVIMVDDAAAARTSVFADSPIYNMQQAATGSVVTLTQGQKVKVVVQTTSTGNFVGEEYSVFSGFFISA